LKWKPSQNINFHVYSYALSSIVRVGKLKLTCSPNSVSKFVQNLIENRFEKWSLERPKMIMGG